MWAFAQRTGVWFLCGNSQSNPSPGMRAAVCVQRPLRGVLSSWASFQTTHHNEEPVLGARGGDGTDRFGWYKNNFK